MTLHIGASDWSYDHWQDVLYPPAPPVTARLPSYLQHFRTVEVNSAYYRWPAHVTFARLYQRLPDDFRMTIKAPPDALHAPLRPGALASTHRPRPRIPRSQTGHPAGAAAAELRL